MVHCVPHPIPTLSFTYPNPLLYQQNYNALDKVFYIVHKKGVRGILLLDKLRMTKRQKLLIDTIVATGCSVKKASEIAGYAKGEKGRVTASKTLRLPHVQEYMQQRVRESIGLNATKASNKMLELSTNAKSEYVQLEASKDILDRAGYKPVEKSMSLVQGNISVSIDLT